MKLPVAFLIALQFLTRLPVTLSEMPSPKQMGGSPVWYPMVGALLGAILVAAGLILADAPNLLAAALVLLIWVALTGALHLDGLADSADAWVGGLGDKARTLTIMKDPRSGPMGVSALVLVLLVKFAALSALLEQHLSAVFWALVLGRCAALALLRATPYVREQGLASALTAHLPRARTGVVLSCWAALALVLNGWLGLWVLACVGLVYCSLRHFMLKRIGGMTGDTAGALIELVECTVLLAWALY